MSNAKYSVTKKDAKAICMKFVNGEMHAPSFEDIEAELRRLGYQRPSRCVAEFLTVASQELQYHTFVAGIGIRLARRYSDIRGDVRAMFGTLDNLRDNCEVPSE